MGMNTISTLTIKWHAHSGILHCNICVGPREQQPWCPDIRPLISCMVLSPTLSIEGHVDGGNNFGALINASLFSISEILHEMTVWMI